MYQIVDNVIYHEAQRLGLIEHLRDEVLHDVQAWWVKSGQVRCEAIALELAKRAEHAAVIHPARAFVVLAVIVGGILTMAWGLRRMGVL